jgi:hypothetical protein
MKTALAPIALAAEEIVRLMPLVNGDGIEQQSKILVALSLKSLRTKRKSSKTSSSIRCTGATINAGSFTRSQAMATASLGTDTTL